MNSGVLRVETVESDYARGLILQVVGRPERQLRFRAGRVLFDENNTVAKHHIMIVEPPDFPIEELVGEQLIDADSA